MKTFVAGFCAILFSVSAWADFDDSLRKIHEAQRSAAQQEYVRENVESNRKSNSQLVSLMHKFAAKHKGLSGEPRHEYGSFLRPQDDPGFDDYFREQDPVRHALIQQSDQLNPSIRRILFSTRDGLDCVSKYDGISCANASTGQHFSNWGDPALAKKYTKSRSQESLQY